MADTVKVDLEQNSKFRVAYDLMTTIAFSENKAGTREYYLTLYRQCFETVYTGKRIEDILSSTQASSTGFAEIPFKP